VNIIVDAELNDSNRATRSIILRVRSNRNNSSIRLSNIEDGIRGIAGLRVQRLNNDRGLSIRVPVENFGDHDLQAAVASKIVLPPDVDKMKPEKINTDILNRWFRAYSISKMRVLPPNFRALERILSQRKLNNKALNSWQTHGDTMVEIIRKRQKLMHEYQNMRAEIDSLPAQNSSRVKELLMKLLQQQMRKFKDVTTGMFSRGECYTSNNSNKEGCYDTPQNRPNDLIFVYFKHDDAIRGTLNTRNSGRTFLHYLMKSAEPSVQDRAVRLSKSLDILVTLCARFIEVIRPGNATSTDFYEIIKDHPYAFSHWRARLGMPEIRYTFDLQKVANALHRKSMNNGTAIYAPQFSVRQGYKATSANQPPNHPVNRPRGNSPNPQGVAAQMAAEMVNQIFAEPDVLMRNAWEARTKPSAATAERRAHRKAEARGQGVSGSDARFDRRNARESQAKTSRSAASMAARGLGNLRMDD
jgi:hypothetical protein